MTASGQAWTRSKTNKNWRVYARAASPRGNCGEPTETGNIRNWRKPNHWGLEEISMFVDTALRDLETKGRPVRVGMVGAGATGRAIALQLGTPAPGIRLVAISNRSVEHGERAFRESGVETWNRA